MGGVSCYAQRLLGCFSGKFLQRMLKSSVSLKILTKNVKKKLAKNVKSPVFLGNFFFKECRKSSVSREILLRMIIFGVSQEILTKKLNVQCCSGNFDKKVKSPVFLGKF